MIEMQDEADLTSTYFIEDVIIIVLHIIYTLYMVLYIIYILLLCLYHFSLVNLYWELTLCSVLSQLLKKYKRLWP